MPAPPGDITRLLSDLQQGRTESEPELFRQIYGELRRAAAHCFRQERPDHTLQPTALVHEAYLRLKHSALPTFENRKHFFAVAARLMRQILIDHARARDTDKRGGGCVPVRLELCDALGLLDATPADVFDLETALQRLEERDERQARIVELRFFAGFSIEETAEVLDIGMTTVKDEWKIARLFLRRELEDSK